MSGSSCDDDVGKQYSACLFLSDKLLGDRVSIRSRYHLLAQRPVGPPILFSQTSIPSFCHRSIFHILPLSMHLSVMLHFAPAWKPECSQLSYKLFLVCHLLISFEKN